MKTLGLLMLDTAFPRLPGDVGHLASWHMPVLAQVVPGAGPSRVVQAADPALLQPFIDAARSLAAQGVAAITTSCGFLVRWQAELQAAVPVPVWTSALLQLPELPSPGVVTVDARSLGLRELAAAGARADTPVEGLQVGCSLQRCLLGNRPVLDGVQAEADVLAAVHRLLQRAPAITDLVLECTNLPPYAAAIERATGLPVHHLMSLVHRRFDLLP